MQFIVVGDIQWTSRNPVARKDDLKAALTAKLQEVFALAKQHNVHAILQVGDLFDGWSLSRTTEVELALLLRQAPVPVFTVFGNHDWMVGGSWQDTPLGSLIARGEVLNAEEPYHFDTNPPVIITGHRYDSATDEDLSQYAPPFIEPGVVHIHIAHGMLLARKAPPGVRHTTLEQLAALPLQAHILCVGHDHLGFGIRRVGRMLVINPGALARMSGAVEELERPVQVALVTVRSTEEVTAELIPLKSARPGPEVLSREHLEREAARETRRAEFLELLAAETVEQALDLASAVASIAEREKLPARVRDEALRRLARAEAGVSTP